MPRKNLLSVANVLLAQGLTFPFLSNGEPHNVFAKTTSSNSFLSKNDEFATKKYAFVSTLFSNPSSTHVAQQQTSVALPFILQSHPIGTLGNDASDRKFQLRSSNQFGNEDVPIVDAEIVSDQEIQISEEEQEKIGNLVADEEWDGLSLELADVVRMAVLEDIKKNSRDFLGKDNYAVGDFSKEIDRRVKEEVATMRGKAEGGEYELGDLSIVLDGKVKEMVCEMTGNDEYSFGDLSTEIDKRVKESVANFCGKEEYEFGDLSKEMAKRTKEGVLKYTGNESYKFGDITKKAVSSFTGKDDYQFGDVTKKMLGNVLGKKGNRGS